MKKQGLELSKQQTPSDGSSLLTWLFVNSSLGALLDNWLIFSVVYWLATALASAAIIGGTIALVLTGILPILFASTIATVALVAGTAVLAFLVFSFISYATLMATHFFLADSSKEEKEEEQEQVQLQEEEEEQLQEEEEAEESDADQKDETTLDSESSPFEIQTTEDPPPSRLITPATPDSDLLDSSDFLSGLGSPASTPTGTTGSDFLSGLATPGTTPTKNASPNLLSGLGSPGTTPTGNTSSGNTSSDLFADMDSPGTSPYKQPPAVRQPWENDPLVKFLDDHKGLDSFRTIPMFVDKLSQTDTMQESDQYSNINAPTFYEFHKLIRTSSCPNFFPDKPAGTTSKRQSKTPDLSEKKITPTKLTYYKSHKLTRSSSLSSFFPENPAETTSKRQSKTPDPSREVLQDKTNLQDVKPVGSDSVITLT